MRFRQRSNPRVHRSPVIAWCRGTCKLLMMMALIALAGWLLFQHTFQSKLAATVENKLNKELTVHGLSASLGQARFIDGRGLVLSDLKLGVAANAITSTSGQESDTSAIVAGLSHVQQQFTKFAMATGDDPIAEFYDVFVHLPYSMPSILLGDAKPSGYEVRRAKLNLVRQSDGQWQIAKFLSAFKPQPETAPVPIRIHDSEIKIVDQTRNPPLIHRLTDVQIDLTPIVHDGRSMVEILMSCAGSETGVFDLVLMFDPEQKTFEANLKAQNIRLSPALFAFCPEIISEKLKPIKSLAGVLNIEGRAVGKIGSELPQFMFVGNLDQFSFDDERFPVPVTRSSAEFLVSDREVQISNATGRFGDGEFSVNYSQRGLLQREQWQINGQLKQILVRHAEALGHQTTRGCKRFCMDFAPEGHFDLDFNLKHDGNSLQRKITCQLQDMAFRFVKFPYRVDQFVGTIEWVNDTTRVNIRSLATAEPLTVTGTIMNLGPDATYALTIAMPGSLPVDEKMIEALEATPALAKIVRDFRPVGRVGGFATMTKQIPRGDVDKYFQVDLKGVDIEHVAFPYPIQNVQGRIIAKNLDFTFENLTGGNGPGAVECRGGWNPVSGLNTHFECHNVVLDRQLQTALSPDLQEIWAGFRPAGTVPQMQVEMTMPIGHRVCNVIVDAQLANGASGSDISIEPTWFPYEINHLQGSLQIGDGQIQARDVVGLHDRTWLSCQGEGEYSEQAWEVRLKNLLATSLKIDDDLLAALPTMLAPPVRQMKYQGLVNVNGEISIAGVRSRPNAGGELARAGFRGLDVPQPSYFDVAPTMAWNLDFIMNDAQMLVGLPLENVFGKVNLSGTYDGQRAQCKGELDIDSLTIYTAPITNVTGPIWLDNDRVAAGVLADPGSLAALSDSSRPLVANPNETRSLSGLAYGGIVKLDAQMINDQRGQFYIQSTLADGDIKSACNDFAPEVKEIEGRAFAAMRMGGEYASVHSYRGEGTVQLRDAKIYKLPKVLKLLKMLPLGRADRALFDSSNVDFMINGTDIDFERIELVGDTVSLIGNGSMNLDQEIDLNFYSIVGRNRVRIPVLNELYHASSQQILWIDVDGTLANPKMHRKVLPQLNDSIRQLFQPVSEGDFFPGTVGGSRTAGTPAVFFR